MFTRCCVGTGASTANKSPTPGSSGGENVMPATSAADAVGYSTGVASGRLRTWKRPPSTSPAVAGTRSKNVGTTDVGRPTGRKCGVPSLITVAFGGPDVLNVRTCTQSLTSTSAPTNTRTFVSTPSEGTTYVR